MGDEENSKQNERHDERCVDLVEVSERQTPEDHDQNQVEPIQGTMNAEDLYVPFHLDHLFEVTDQRSNLTARAARLLI